MILLLLALLIPGGKDGIGFDDLNFSKEMGKLMVPAGNTGKLYLIDPATNAMTSVGGFTKISSVDEGLGYFFVPDHGTHKLVAVDIKTGAIAASAPLANDPDFVRFVKSTSEVWVTEPDAKINKQIEVFAFTAGDKPALSHNLDIAFTDGPESLTIDQTRNRAYTNIGQPTAAIDLNTHKIVAQWTNGCDKPHGTAVDEQRGFLFVGCKEGKAVALDLNQDGKQVGMAATGEGVDLVDFNPHLSHLYVPAGKSATLSVLGVSSKGELSMLGSVPAAMRSHCVATDGQDNVWVCDPKHGQLLKYKDTLPAVK